MCAPSRQRRPKGSPLALGGGEEEEVVGRKPGQPHQGNPCEERQGRWAGVYPCVVTIPAVMCVLDSDPSGPSVGEDWGCWMHRWPTCAG